MQAAVFLLAKHSVNDLSIIQVALNTCVCVCVCLEQYKLMYVCVCLEHYVCVSECICVCVPARLE